MGRWEGGGINGVARFPDLSVERGKKILPTWINDHCYTQATIPENKVIPSEERKRPHNP